MKDRTFETKAPAWVSALQCGLACQADGLQVTDQFVLWTGDYVGNSLLLWKSGGAGYTCDLSEAQIFSQEEAARQHKVRNSDIPIPVHMLQPAAQIHVNLEKVPRDKRETFWDHVKMYQQK